MTRNVYVGALFDSILSAPSADVLAERVDSTLPTLFDSFPPRAPVLARDTAGVDPDVVGFQEVARISVRHKDAVRDTVASDYLEILLRALSAHGAEYETASLCQAADAELPWRDDMFVRLSVRNVLLVRKGMRVTHAAASCFGENLSATAGGKGGVPITVLRGWAAADIGVGHSELRVVNTHFETQPTPHIQRAQAEELMRILEPVRTPLVVMGDLNSDALGGDTPTYGMLVSSGFTDAWRAVRDDDGCTCCHSADLRDPTTRLTKRIDHVLVRGDIEVLDAGLVGDRSRTENGLWASDHAGVVVDLRV